MAEGKKGNLIAVVETNNFLEVINRMKKYDLSSKHADSNVLNGVAYVGYVNIDGIDINVETFETVSKEPEMIVSAIILVYSNNPNAKDVLKKSSIGKYLGFLEK